MNILIRADSSSYIGTGHIMRDIVLANKYRKQGHKVVFATQKLEGNITYKIIENDFEVITLKSHDKKELISILIEYEINLLVIDHYGIDYKYEVYIKENTSVKILSFDDTYEKHYCDILINANIYAKSINYKGLVPSNCELRCGFKYVLLRDEFFIQKKKKKESVDKTMIFIAIGGTDHTNINIPILKVLSRFKNIKVNIVTTIANKNLKDLVKFCKKRKFVELHINANNVAELMNLSDFAIVTPSVTINEIFFMNIPFIAIKTADNQKETYKYLKKKNYLVMEKWNRVKLYLNVNKVLNARKY